MYRNHSRVKIHHLLIQLVNDQLKVSDGFVSVTEHVLLTSEYRNVQKKIRGPSYIQGGRGGGFGGL